MRKFSYAYYTSLLIVWNGLFSYTRTTITTIMIIIISEKIWQDIFTLNYFFLINFKNSSYFVWEWECGVTNNKKIYGTLLSVSDRRSLFLNDRCTVLYWVAAPVPVLFKIWFYYFSAHLKTKRKEIQYIYRFSYTMWRMDSYNNKNIP